MVARTFFISTHENAINVSSEWGVGTLPYFSFFIFVNHTSRSHFNPWGSQTQTTYLVPLRLYFAASEQIKLKCVKKFYDSTQNSIFKD